MRTGTKRYPLLSLVLVIVAGAILVGGLVYDLTREGEAPNLMWLYVVAVFVALMGVGAGYRGSERDS